MKKGYFEYWDLYDEEPEDPLSKEEAEKRHQGKERYVITFLQDINIKYVVEMNFDDYYCAVMFLTTEQKSNKRESFVKYKGKLFLKGKTFLTMVFRN